MNFACHGIDLGIEKEIYLPADLPCISRFSYYDATHEAVKGTARSTSDQILYTRPVFAWALNLSVQWWPVGSGDNCTIISLFVVTAKALPGMKW